jgi:hypothetical protein
VNSDTLLECYTLRMRLELGGGKVGASVGCLDDSMCERRVSICCELRIQEDSSSLMS